MCFGNFVSLAKKPIKLWGTVPWLCDSSGPWGFSLKWWMASLHLPASAFAPLSTSRAGLRLCSAAYPNPFCDVAADCHLAAMRDAMLDHLRVYTILGAFRGKVPMDTVAIMLEMLAAFHW